MIKRRTKPIKTLVQVLSAPCFLMTGYLGFAAEQSQTPQDDQVYELSPFQVESSNEDVGYYASSTLAGTRMNSKLRDIASSITVVTAQQLEDTSAVDLNDIFLYESNTEGTAQYTEFSLDRYGAAYDQVQASPETANRIRGIGSAAISRDYFVGFDRVPLDSYNVDRLTINRGPNSVLYGLGSPSGLVNSSTAQALIGSNNTRVEFRYGKWDDTRGLISLNRTLIEDKLAVRFAALVSDRGIPQEPAYDESDRQYFAASYRPFEKTTLRFNFENVTQDRQGVNAATPADLVTPWISNGRPMWNPNTFTATYQDGRQVTTTSTSLTTIQSRIPGIRPDEHLSRPYWNMENGVEVGPRLQRRIGASSNLFTSVDTGLPGSFLDPSRVGSSNSGTRNTPWVVPGYYTGVSLPSAQPEMLFFSDSIFERNQNYPGYIAPGVQDKSLYDWDNLNISAANFYDLEAKNYQFMIEQQITDNLFVELGLHHEEYDSWEENGINANQAKIYVDVNSHYLDGTINPFAGKPFMETRQEVDANFRHEDADTLRATVAWELDFTDSDGFAQWLGRHNIMGLAQKHDQEGEGARYRPAEITTNLDSGWVSITSDGTINSFINGTNPQKQSNRRYYIGDVNGRITKSTGMTPTRAFLPANPTVDPRGPGWGNTYLYNFRWAGRDGDTSYPISGGAPRGEWVETPQEFAFNLHGNPGTYRRQLNSYSGAIQSFFWDDRIVTTFGWRKDTQKDNSPDNVDEAGNDIPSYNDEENGYYPGDYEFGLHNPDSLYGHYPNPWDEVSGTTSTKGIVVHPTRSISLHYNESDNFTPQSPAISLYNELLPNTTGSGRDWGVAFSLLENKLIAKLNWYKADALNSRNGGDTGTVVGRAVRVENESNWGFMDFWEWNIEARDGLTPGALNFFSRDDPATAPYLDELYELASLPPGTLRALDYPMDDVRNVSSEGTEVELSYNPTRNFNIKLNVTRAETVIDGAAPNLAQWEVERMAAYTAMGPNGATNSNFPMNQQVNWWDAVEIVNGGDPGDDPTWAPLPGDPDYRWQGSSPQGFQRGNVLAPLGLLIEQNGKPQSQSREWRVNLLATYRFTEGVLDGTAVGGSFRWEDDASIGYYGDILETGQLVYDINRQIVDPGTTYFDFWASYSRRIMDDRVRMKVQLNLRNIFEDGGLKPIRANPDGGLSTFRIVEPGSWFLTTSFDF